MGLGGVLDDAHPTEKVRIYDKGYEKPPQFTDDTQMAMWTAEGILRSMSRLMERTTGAAAHDAAREP